MPKRSQIAKKLFQLCSFLVIALVLAACSLLPGGGEEQAINLEYWGLWESQTTIDAVINDYKQANPNVNITYKRRSPQQYRESLEAQIQSGKGPDIFRFHNTWVPMLKEELAPVPSSVVSASDFKKNFYPVAARDLTVGGKLVGIPLEFDGLSLFYNEDIFKAAAVDKPPASWTEFAQVAAKLTVRDTAGNIRTAGAGIGTAGNVDHFSDILATMIFQNGGDPRLPTDKQTADALEYYTKFAKGPNRVWDQTLPATTVAFAGGNLAMYFAPSWRAIEIKNANPLLKFKIAPLPQLEGGRVTWASYWVEGVSQNSQQKEEAWKFIKYLQADETLIKLYSEAAKSPGRFFGEPYPKQALASKIASDPLIGSFIVDAPYARSFPMASRTFDNGLNDQVIKAYEDAVNSVAGGTPAKNALETTAKNLTTIFNRYNSP